MSSFKPGDLVFNILTREVALVLKTKDNDFQLYFSFNNKTYWSSCIYWSFF